MQSTRRARHRLPVRLALALLVLVATSQATLALTVVAGDAPGTTLPSPAIAVFADPQGRLQAADLLAGRHEDARVSPRGSPPNLGYPRHPHWTLIELRNESDAPLERLLVLWRGSTHRQDATVQILPDEGAAPPLRSSLGTDVASRHAVLRLVLPPRSTTRIATRFETYTALSFDYRLLQPEDLAAIDRIDYWFFGLLVGIVFAIGIYVLALYYALRERLYLLFATFALGNIVYQLHTEGYAYLVWPEYLRPWGNAVGTYGGTLFALMIILFIRDYMALPRLVPRLDRWFVTPVLIVLGLVFIVYPFAPWLGNTLAALGVIVGTVAASTAALRGSMISPPVWSFLVATLAFFALGVIHLLKRIGVLPDVQALALVLQFGSAITTIAFAIAVMERIRRMVEERRLAQIEYADRLEHQVAERTSELRQAKEAAEQALAQLTSTQHQLLESEKMASLGQLVAGVAHEVNTPLGIAVTASSHLAERSRLMARRLEGEPLARSELADYIDETGSASAMIGRNLERAAHLIRSFKQVSVDRTSDGRRRFALANSLADLIESLKVSWKRRPIDLVVECPADIEMDSFPGALGQVLTNLIQNALLHAFEPEQAGCMRISVRELDAQRIELVFEDDGKGLDAPTLARIFDPFFTTKRNQGGTGLGLNIAYNLTVQKLGGQIEAWSRPGQGLRLTLRLPRSAPNAAASPAG